MRTSLHAAVILVSDNVHFVIVFSNIYGRRMRFSERSQTSLSEKSIFGDFEVIFLNVSIFPRVSVVVSC